MKRSCLSYILGLFLALGLASPSFAEDPLLEAYTIGHGGNVGGRPAGLKSTVTDRFFGNGRARARIDLETFGSTNRLALRVSRNLPQGSSAPALRVTRVEVLATDAAGALVYSEVLGNFTFGDGQSGRQSFVVKDVPSTARTYQVRFFGAYE